MPSVPYSADDERTMLGTTHAPITFNTSSPTAPRTAPGTSGRHPTSTSASTFDVHRNRTKLTSTPSAIPNGANTAGRKRTTVVAAMLATKMIAAPIAHSTPPALSRSPRSCPCHARLYTDRNAPVRPSPDHARPTRPTTVDARRLSDAFESATLTLWAASP